MNTLEEQQAIELLAAGTPQEEIAATLGVSQSTISRLSKRKQEDIQKQAEHLIEAMPSIVEQIKRDIETSNMLSTVLSQCPPEFADLRIEKAKLESEKKQDSDEYRDVVRRESDILTQYTSKLSPFFWDNPVLMLKFIDQSYKKQADIMRAAGILPAASQSIFIQQLIQNRSTTVFSPVVLNILGEHIRKALGEPIPEAEVVEEGK